MDTQLYEVESLLFSCFIIVRQLCSHKSDLTSLKIFKDYRSDFRCAHVLQSNNSIVLIEIQDIEFTFLNVTLYYLVAIYFFVSDVILPCIYVDQSVFETNQNEATNELNVLCRSLLDYLVVENLSHTSIRFAFRRDLLASVLLVVHVFLFINLSKLAHKFQITPFPQEMVAQVFLFFVQQCITHLYFPCSGCFICICT